MPQHSGNLVAVRALLIACTRRHEVFQTGSQKVQIKLRCNVDIATCVR